MNEIGSEFWLSSLPNDSLEGSPEWINSWGNHVLTSSGRGAISLLLEHIKEEVLHKNALLPSYICESVIMPFIKQGYTCYFYDINKDLSPKKESLNIYVKSKIGIVLHMGYFGFPTNNNIKKQITQFKDKGTIIVEDLTHTLFSKYNRFMENDYYVASLRKWTGLPTGGFLASKNSIFRETLCEHSTFYNYRKEALIMKGKYIELNREDLKEKYLAMFKIGETILNKDNNPYLIDSLSRTIIQKLNIKNLILKRRQNFSFLLSALNNIPEVTSVFNKLPDDICPFFFPIYVEKGREIFRNKLIDKKVYCPVHWPTPPQIHLSKSISKRIYESIMSLPCDQRYGNEEMQRIVDIIKRFNSC
jgi:hypothetical protein